MNRVRNSLSIFRYILLAAILTSAAFGLADERTPPTGIPIGQNDVASRFEDIPPGCDVFGKRTLSPRASSWHEAELRDEVMGFVRAIRSASFEEWLSVIRGEAK